MYNGEKKCNFKLKTDLENTSETHTLDSDVPELNPHDEDEERSCKSLVNPKFSVWWLEPWSWHTSDEDGKESEGYTYFFGGGRWFSRKSYGNPNS